LGVFTGREHSVNHIKVNTFNEQIENKNDKSAIEIDEE